MLNAIGTANSANSEVFASASVTARNTGRRVEFAENSGNRLVNLRVAEMAPIGPLRRPGAGPHMPDQRVEWILRRPADIDGMDVRVVLGALAPELQQCVPIHRVEGHLEPGG